MTAPTVRKPLLLPRRKTVYFWPNAGAPVPLIHCEKKACELEVGLGFGDGLDVGGADGLVGVLREHAAEEVGEDVVAHLPAEHVEDHGALFEGLGLELRGEGVEAAEGGEGVGVVGEGAGGDVGDGVLEGGLAAGVFEVQQLGVAGHAVGDPGVVEGGGRDLVAPPLVGDGVGEEAGVAAVGADGDDFRGPGGGDGVGGELDDVELAGFGGAEEAGEEFELLGDGGGEVVGLGFVGFGGEDADVGDAGRCDGIEELAGDDGAGEAGALPVEAVLGSLAPTAFWPVKPLPMTRSPFGTVMWVSAVKRSVKRPGMEMGNQRPG